MAEIPYKDREKYSDVRTIAERACVELREEDGKPFHCGERMPTKHGLFGPDYAKCGSCGLTMWNAASPHVNGGYVFTEEVLEEYFDEMWTYERRDT